MNEIYIFSGLGADERAFQFIHFTNHRVSFIKWVTPNKNERIEIYAERLAKQITMPHPIFIGLSFSGIMAVEVAKIIKPKKLILIASVKHQDEISMYYRLAGKLRVHKLLPTVILKSSSFITNWFFGISKRGDRKLLAEILKDTDELFLKRAIDKIVGWWNKTLPENCTHIHGTADRILPYRFVKADIAISGGGHFMTVNKAFQLSDILDRLLND